jgi:hypothetical protein
VFGSDPKATFKAKHQFLFLFFFWTDLGYPPLQFFVVGCWIDKVINHYEFIG